LGYNGLVTRLVLPLLFGMATLAWGQAQPLPVAGERRAVQAGLYVIDVRRIDDVQRTAEVDFVVLARWHDPALEGKHSGPVIVPRHSIWNPDLGVFNNHDLRTQRSEDLTAAPDGSVTQVQRYIGTISIDFDLADFPLDRHDLRFELATTRSEEVDLQVLAPLTGQDAELALPGWKCGEGAAEIFTHEMLHLRLPGLRYTIPLRRVVPYYVWNVFLPLGLVVLMAFCSFWIPPQHAAPRIGVSATAMLTVIAYRFALAQHVPQLDYLTRLDTFLLASTVLVFMAVLVAVAATHAAAQEQDERAKRIDGRARVVLPALFLLSTLGALWA
jgi:hypothetical protein